MAQPGMSCINTAAPVVTEVISELNEIGRQVNALLESAEDALDNFVAAGEDAVAALQTSADYAANTNHVPKTYAQPDLTAAEPDFADRDEVVDAPEMPDPNEPLLTECEQDALWAKEEAKVIKINRKEEYDQMYKAARGGIGMADPTMAIGLKETRQNASMRLAEVSLNRTVQEGTWRREDKLKMYGLAAEIYSASMSGFQSFIDAETNRYRARIDHNRSYIESESARLGWSDLQLKDVLERADKIAQYSLQKVQAISELMTNIQETFANLKVGLAQGLTSAMDYSLSASGNVGHSSSCSESESITWSGQLAGA